MLTSRAHDSLPHDSAYPFSKGSFKGSTVLITGANNPFGIGAATARAFAACGARVAISYLTLPVECRRGPTLEAQFGIRFYEEQRAKSADEVVASITKGGGITASFEADLAKPNAPKMLFDRVEEVLGPVDILVNNASHYEPFGDTILSISAEAIDRTYQVNIRASILLMQEFALRHNVRGATRGRIVNLSTDAAQCFATQITYGASKAAIEALTRSVALELSPLGITVNAVAPGPTQTGYISAEDELAILAEIPLGRLGKPQDIANTILFLSSSASDWITGQVIRVSGGHIF